MTAAAGTNAPPEPGLTPDDVIARATALASDLVSRQAETEKRTYYAADTHEAFRAAGLYRLLVPRRYGGYEFDAGTFLRVSTALARGCPSTGWMYLFGAAHALVVATLFGERAQDEVFAGGDFICPAVVGPAGHAEPADDGGWIVSGTWRYCSGVPYATHFLGHTLVAGDDGGPPRPLLFVIPRGDWTRLDDWGGQLGLRGSGSHSVLLDAVHVPAWRALDGVHLSQTSVTGGTPGRALHGNPEYGGGPLSFTLLELGALAVGMAQGALDAYEDLMRSRTTIYPPIVARSEDPYYQATYGEAAGRIAAAEAALRGAVAQWSAVAAEGPAAVTRESEWRIATISREAIRLSWQAVEGHLFPTAGSSAVRDGERMERIWRDMSMLHSHGGVAIVLASMANQELTRARFGI